MIGKARCDELLELLSKPVWSANDIMRFDLNLKTRQSATNVKTKAIRLANGSVPYGRKYVSIDAILQLYGTTREKEIENITNLKNKVVTEEDENV